MILAETEVRYANERKENIMQKLDSLEGLLLHEVQDLYSAEKQLVKALPKVAKKVSSSELKSAVEEHLEQTEEHVSRLEQVFEMLGSKAIIRKLLTPPLYLRHRKSSTMKSQATAAPPNGRAAWAETT